MYSIRTITARNRHCKNGHAQGDEKKYIAKRWETPLNRTLFVVGNYRNHEDCMREKPELNDFRQTKYALPVIVHTGKNFFQSSKRLCNLERFRWCSQVCIQIHAKGGMKRRILNQITRQPLNSFFLILPTNRHYENTQLKKDNQTRTPKYWCHNKCHMYDCLNCTTDSCQDDPKAKPFEQMKPRRDIKKSTHPDNQKLKQKHSHCRPCGTAIWPHTMSVRQVIKYAGYHKTKAFRKKSVRAEPVSIILHMRRQVMKLGSKGVTA